MQNFVRNHKILTISIAVVSALILWPSIEPVADSARGGLVARYDISCGHYEVQGYGLPVPWRSEYVRLLDGRYGVKFRIVAGCIVSTGLANYVDSYNRVSTAAINQKFGHDVFKECSEEARQNWDQTHKTAKPSS
jgi:hypothetical protein